MHKVYLILLLIFISSCSNTPLGIGMMPKPPTDGPESYRTGWSDGCETGMTAYSNSVLRTMYRTKVNSPMMSDSNYNKGWQLGNRYCSYYVSHYLAYGAVDAGFPGSTDLRPSNTWVDFPEGLDLFKAWRIQPIGMN